MLIPGVALWSRFTHISHGGTDTLLVVAALYACAHLLWGPFHFISVGIFQMHRPSQTQPNTPKYTQKVPPDWGRGPHLWSTRGNKELIGHGCTRLVIVMFIGITGINLQKYPHIISYHHIIQACYCSGIWRHVAPPGSASCPKIQPPWSVGWFKKALYGLIDAKNDQQYYIFWQMKAYWVLAGF